MFFRKLDGVLPIFCGVRDTPQDETETASNVWRHMHRRGDVSRRKGSSPLVVGEDLCRAVAADEVDVVGLAL